MKCVNGCRLKENGRMAVCNECERRFNESMYRLLMTVSVVRVTAAVDLVPVYVPEHTIAQHRAFAKHEIDIVYEVQG